MKRGRKKNITNACTSNKEIPHNANAKSVTNSKGEDTDKKTWRPPMVDPSEIKIDTQ